MLIDLTLWEWMVAGAAVLLLGVAKAGFGGGIGLLAAPMLAMSIPAKDSVGILLPILCAIDLVALPVYWKNWDRRAVLLLFPGAVLGVVAGTMLLTRLNNQWIGLFIGVIAVLFVLRHVYSVVSARPEKSGTGYGWGHGTGYGMAAGFTSTIAHAAGPVATMFLLPLRLDRRRFVGTTVFFFALLNATKLPPYVTMDIIRMDTLKMSGCLLPFVPVGVALGLWLNRSVNEKWFVRIVYVALFLAGLDLILKNSMKLLG